MQKRYDWKPVVKSLIEALAAAGFVDMTIDDGDGINQRFADPAAGAELACAVHESLLIASHPSKPSRRCWAQLVLGNSPAEVVSDYRAGFQLLDDVLEAWADSWEGKECPLEGPPAPLVLDPARDALFSALSDLLDWGRNWTSPIDQNSPHKLLIAAHEAIELSKASPPPAEKLLKALRNLAAGVRDDMEHALAELPESNAAIDEALGLPPEQPWNSPVPPYDPATDGDYSGFLARNNCD